MTRALLSIGIFVFSQQLFAQDSIPRHWVSLNLGSQVTSLNFTASSGDMLDYSKELNFTNGIGYSFMRGKVILDLNVDYYSFSSTYQDDNINTSLELGYFQPAVNLSYMFKVGSFPLRPRLGVGYGHSFLIYGNQILNGALTDVKKAEAINSTDGGINLNAGVILFNKSNICVSSMYNYRIGLSNIENETNNQETTTTIHGLLLKIQLAF